MLEVITPFIGFAIFPGDFKPGLVVSSTLGSIKRGIDESTVAHLAAIYGSRFSEIIDLVTKDPTGKQSLCPHCPDIVAQVWHAVEEESALTIGDFLLRRGAAGFASCQGLDGVERIAQEMGRLLGWSASEQEDQIEIYRSWAALNNSWKQSLPTTR